MTSMQQGRDYNSNLASDSFCSRSNRANCRSLTRSPPLYAFSDAAALPSLVLGPVDFFQGRHCRIATDCRARRSGVHP